MDEACLSIRKIYTANCDKQGDIYRVILLNPTIISLLKGRSIRLYQVSEDYIQTNFQSRLPVRQN